MHFSGANGATLFFPSNVPTNYFYILLSLLYVKIFCKFSFFPKRKKIAINNNLFLIQTFLGGDKSLLDYFVFSNTLQLIAFWANVCQHPLLDGVQMLQLYITDGGVDIWPSFCGTAGKEANGKVGNQ